MKRVLSLFFFSITLQLIVGGCSNSGDADADYQRKKTSEVAHDLAEIKKRGKLVALTDNSSTSYFIYRGQAMGFEYELLSLYAKHLGVELEMKIVDNLDDIFDSLNKGNGDIVAANLTITRNRRKQVDFCEPHLKTRQVLVQRLPEDWRTQPIHVTEDELLRDITNLAGKKIHVRKGSSFYERLIHLREEIGEDFEIVDVSGEYETEQLIGLVANGDIDYTVADENIAKLNKKYFPNIDVQTPLSFPQKIAWAIRKNSDSLEEHLNQWILSMKKHSDYYTIRNRYFKARSSHSKKVKSTYSSFEGGRISPYDSLIQAYSNTLGWDWRLIAAQIYQESKFDQNAESWRGAVGLMQLLPETAKQFNIDNLKDPSKNIEAGIKYLEYLNEFWRERIPDSLERVKFTLASFNVGPGHVLDAQRLAEKYNHNPTTWDGNVEKFLAKKAQPKYYQDEVVRYGYCRGTEPVQYVEKIFNNYRHYRTLIADLQ